MKIPSAPVDDRVEDVRFEWPVQDDHHLRGLRADFPDVLPVRRPARPHLLLQHHDDRLYRRLDWHFSLSLFLHDHHAQVLTFWAHQLRRLCQRVAHRLVPRLAGIGACRRQLALSVACVVRTSVWQHGMPPVAPLVPLALSSLPLGSLLCPFSLSPLPFVVPPISLWLLCHGTYLPVCTLIWLLCTGRSCAVVTAPPRTHRAPPMYPTFLSSFSCLLSTCIVLHL